MGGDSPWPKNPRRAICLDTKPPDCDAIDPADAPTGLSSSQRQPLETFEDAARRKSDPSPQQTAIVGLDT